LRRFFVLAAALIAGACDAPGPPVLLGGQTSIFDRTSNAFSQPAPGLDRDRELQFFVGNSFFNQNWVAAPASTQARDGLGPFFNARSCAGCHLRDGRGRPPEDDAELGTGLLLRLGIPGLGPDGGNAAHLAYGGQLQDQAVSGVPAEGRIVVEYVEIPGTLPDGTPYSLRKPTYRIAELGYGELGPDVLVSPRVAPQVIGMGLLEAVPEEEILSRADPLDEDGDGISGRPNRVWDVALAATVVGRFGWKANQPTVRQQVAGAFAGDMGISTSLFAVPECTASQELCLSAPNGGSPEILDEDLEKVVLYASSLAVPAFRDPENSDVRRGMRLFDEIGCVGCHTPMLSTGSHPTIPALSGQTIHPYTDLLLHDMGSELADERPDFEATGREWRTPPLWGIGLIPTVNRHAYYLHDGRARGLTEAILWHGGEGQASRDRFAALSVEARAALVRFLESL
jgi:CxxC motif-containing protein (DUF1111 family)